MFASILLPLDGSSNAARPLRTAAWLAQQLKGQLHILTATSERRSAMLALEQLKVPTDLRQQVILHQLPANAEVAILKTMEDLHTDLLVISALGEGGAASGEPVRVGHVARAMLQQTDVPVLLAPPSFNERLPMRSALIPVSGEPDTDEALDLAIRLANCLQLELHVTHVLSAEMAEADYTSDMPYTDTVHHEFSARLSDILRRASPRCSPDDFDRVVANVCLCHGRVLDELLRMVDKTQADLLVVGWHGKLHPGRAELIKQLIETITCPILFFRSRSAPYFSLSVGEEFE